MLIFDVHHNGKAVKSFHNETACLGAILAVILNGPVLYRVRVKIKGAAHE